MRKQYLLLVLTTFIFVSLFGMSLTMSMDKNGKMSNCPFMNNSSSICQMSVGDHIAKWRGLFEASPQLNAFFLLLALFTTAIFVKRVRTNLAFAPPSYVSYKRYKQNHLDTNLFNNLIVAFSDGILHPQVYA